MFNSHHTLIIKIFIINIYRAKVEGEVVGDWSFDENYGSYDGDREVQMIVLTRLQQSKMSRRYRRSLLFHLNFLLKQKS